MLPTVILANVALVAPYRSTGGICAGARAEAPRALPGPKTPRRKRHRIYAHDHLAQPPDQTVEFFAVHPADSQPGAIVENDGRITVKKRLPLLDPFEVDQRRTAETKKFPGGEPRFCRPHRFAKEVGLLADVQTQIIPLGLDPINLVE